MSDKEKEVVKKKAGRPARSLNLNIKKTFWCKELKRMVQRGVYKAKDQKEIDIIEEYLK